MSVVDTMIMIYLCIFVFLGITILVAVLSDMEIPWKYIILQVAVLVGGVIIYFVSLGVRVAFA